MQGIEVWPNAEAAGSYDGEVAYFTNWLTLRIAYLDSLFNNKTPTSITLDTNVPPQHTDRTPDRPLRNGFPACTDGPGFRCRDAHRRCFFPVEWRSHRDRISERQWRRKFNG